MKLISINWRPTDRQLRQFGVACLIAFPMLTWIWVGGIQAVSVSAAMGLACTALGWVWPWAIRPLYVALSVLAAPLGMILGEIFLLLIYFAVVLPMSVMFRMRRRDTLKLDFDRQRDSYWEPKKQPKDAKSYFRQF